jgi:molecular chaperone DnaK (HSP70)
VETAGGYSDTLIRANSPVPCAKTSSFRTCRDGQTVVVIRVAQGEDTRFTRNTYLGELELAGIPAAIRGEVEIAVTFALDADGILNVRAEVPQTGKQASAVLRLLGVVTDPRDIEKMMAAQKRHAVV